MPRSLVSATAFLVWHARFWEKKTFIAGTKLFPRNIMHDIQLVYIRAAMSHAAGWQDKEQSETWVFNAMSNCAYCSWKLSPLQHRQKKLQLRVHHLAYCLLDVRPMTSYVYTQKGFFLLHVPTASSQLVCAVLLNTRAFSRQFHFSRHIFQLSSTSTRWKQ